MSDTALRDLKNSSWVAHWSGLTQRAPDWRVRAAFSSIFLASGLYCSQAFPHPTRQQVTLTVGRHRVEIMSFNHYAHKVRNPELSIWTRLSALRSCIRMLSVLTNESYHLAVTRFDDRFGFNRSRGDSLDPPAESNLLDALTAIEEERNLLLAKIQIDAQLQKSRKRQ